MTLLEVIAYAPVVVSTAVGLRALWRMVRRKLPARPAVPPLAAVCGCPEGRVVRYEAVDGGELGGGSRGERGPGELIRQVRVRRRAVQDHL